MTFNITTLYTAEIKLRNNNLIYYKKDLSNCELVKTYGCTYCGYRLTLGYNDKKIYYNGIGGILLNGSIEFLLDILNNNNINIINDLVSMNYVNDNYKMQINYLYTGIKNKDINGTTGIVYKVICNVKDYINEVINKQFK